MKDTKYIIKETEFKTVKGLGRIPKNWESGSLSNLAYINPKKDVKNLNKDDLVTFIAMEDTSENSVIINKTNKKLCCVEKGYTYFAEKDILFAKITPCLENGKGGLAKNLTNGIGFGSTEFHVLRPKRKESIEFLYQHSKSKKMREKAAALMIGSAGQQRIQKEFFEQYMIAIPSYKEQYIIGEILYKYDQLIEKTEQIIEKYQKVKKGLMDDLLTGKVRIKDGKMYRECVFKEVKSMGKISNDWMIKKLGEILKVKSGEFLPQNKIVNGVYPVYGGNGITAYHTDYLFDESFIVIGRVGEKCGCIHISLEKCWITDNALYISEIIKEADFKYIYYLLNYIDLNSYANKNAQPVISGEKIYSIKIGMPNLLEQKQISKILFKQDELIEKEKQYLEKLKKLKAGLMEDLLTGKVRVI